MGKIPIKHTKGPTACNKIAWYWAREICLDDIIATADIIYLNGKTPQLDEVATCSSCGNQISLPRSSLDGLYG